MRTWALQIGDVQSSGFIESQSGITRDLHTIARDQEVYNHNALFIAGARHAAVRLCVIDSSTLSGIDGVARAALPAQDSVLDTQAGPWACTHGGSLDVGGGHTASCDAASPGGGWGTIIHRAARCVVLQRGLGAICARCERPELQRERAEPRSELQ